MSSYLSPNRSILKSLLVAEPGAFGAPPPSVPPMVPRIPVPLPRFFSSSSMEMSLVDWMPLTLSAKSSGLLADRRASSYVMRPFLYSPRRDWSKVYMP